MSINILFWNCNGIKSKCTELENFARQNNIHKILLQRTRISPLTTLKISNYITYRQDRPIKPKSPSSGGTAILIRKNIVHKSENVSTSMDSTSISIQFKNEQVRISSLYKSPNVPISTIDLDTLTNHGGLFIADGDLNAKHSSWNCHTTNQAG